jgi:hypothetical protein
MTIAANEATVQSKAPLLSRIVNAIMLLHGNRVHAGRYLATMVALPSL